MNDSSCGTGSTSGANSSDGTNSTFDPIPAIPIPPQSAMKLTPIPTPEKNGVITPLVTTTRERHFPGITPVK